MDKAQKKELVIRELGKEPGFGESIGEEHSASTGIREVWAGEEKSIAEGAVFSFSAEVERVSEFSIRLFWYYGTITVKNNSTSSEIHVRDESDINIFMPPKNRIKEIKRIVSKVQKELHLTGKK